MMIQFSVFSISIQISVKIMQEMPEL